MPMQDVTAVAIATADREHIFPSYDPTPLVTGVGFLSVTTGKRELHFDFAARALVAGEDEDRIKRWLDANLPGGLLIGFELAETHPFFDEVPYVNLAELHRPGRRRASRRQIDLSVWPDEKPATLAEACRPLCIPTDTRNDDARYFDHHLSRPDGIVKAVTIDCIAAFRLGVHLAAAEMRDGSAFQAEVEAALFAWLAQTELVGGGAHLGLPEPAPEPVLVPAPSPEPDRSLTEQPPTKAEQRRILLAAAREAYAARGELNGDPD